MSECTHDCSSCSENCSSREQKSMKAEQNKMSNVKKVIGIVSGKGGVGKSLITALLACGMQRKDYKAAILDADITGPSIPKMLGITRKALGNEFGILPCESTSGIKVMSVNLLLENDTDPVVWRGPVIAGTVTQFWSDVVWEDVDYMFVDMPPGTGDVPLTVFQSLPVDGIIIVTSPQDLVSMIVEKAVKMAKMMNIPVLGIVENMSYVECPDCNKKIYVYGESEPEKVAEKFETELLGQIPINPDIAKYADSGKIERVNSDEWLSKAFDKLKSIE